MYPKHAMILPITAASLWEAGSPFFLVGLETKQESSLRSRATPVLPSTDPHKLLSPGNLGLLYLVPLEGYLEQDLTLSQIVEGVVVMMVEATFEGLP